MLERYGWSPSLQQVFDSLVPGFVPARVLIQQRGRYEVMAEAGPLNATLAGKLMHEKPIDELPVAGDWVAVAARPAEQAATIHHVLPRSSSFVRRASGPGGGAQVVAANADLALLASSLNDELNLRRMERYLATAWSSGARPLIVLTKSDLCLDVDKAVREVQGIAFGVPVFAVSVVSGNGLEELASEFEAGRTAVLLGSSGVGKSTLVNALAGASIMETGEIREDDARGRHTTTHRELILLPSGGLILDTPGMRELGLFDSADGVSAAFEDVESIARGCRFGDCRHEREPGCAVRAALAEGTLAHARWQSYLKLNRELAFLDRKDDHDARAAHRKIWIQRTKNYRARKKDRWRDL